VVEKVAPPPDRRALHAARRAQRRDRRKAAALGLGIVGATLAATVAVLGVVR
jgi:ferric-dicitrate binding protein FerR (iron transport regulator)